MADVPSGTETGPARVGSARADALLLATAAIWGFAFVAQRSGMQHVGPFTFNALRFALGGAVVLSGTWALSRIRRGRAPSVGNGPSGGYRRRTATATMVVGVLLFAGASLQQGGLVTTDAGKAGFITGLYVVLVPLIGLGMGESAGGSTWLAVGCSIAGLYLLSIHGAPNMHRGELLVLAGAVCWALHVLAVARFAPNVDPARLAGGQFLLCATLSAVAAAAVEHDRWGDIAGAALPLAYAGVVSVGVAYTLQVYGQRHAPPAHAAIVMSLEAVFAVVGGWLLLGERLSPREMTGAALMLCGMVVSGLAMRAPRRA